MNSLSYKGLACYTCSRELIFQGGFFPQGELKDLVKFSSGVKEHIPARRVDCATKPGSTVNEALVTGC